MDRYFLVLILFVGLNNLIADDHMPESYGMEGYQCNFDSEKNMDDVTDFIFLLSRILLKVKYLVFQQVLSEKIQY